MALLPVDYKDDILSGGMEGKRRYIMSNNTDGTVSLEDATEYDQQGSNFGALDINQTNAAVNALNKAPIILEYMSVIDGPLAANGTITFTVTPTEIEGYKARLVMYRSNTSSPRIIASQPVAQTSGGSATLRLLNLTDAEFAEVSATFSVLYYKTPVTAV